MSAGGHPFVPGRTLREADGGDVLEAKAGADGPWVDASLAPIIEALDDLGYETLQSDSGIRADHPGRESYRPTEGYISISIVEDDSDRVAAIRRAAERGGLVAGFNTIFGEGRTAFGAEGITVRMPYTNDGASKNQLRLRANEMFENRDGHSIDFYKGGDIDIFIEKVSERNAIRRELAGQDHGGVFDAPDDRVFSMWQSFISALQSETAASLDVAPDDLPPAAEAVRDLAERAMSEPVCEQLPDVIRGVVNRWGRDPCDINMGECAIFADAVRDQVPDVTVVDNVEWVAQGAFDVKAEHAFLECGGRFYDSETPDGVDDWRDLPFFQRNFTVADVSDAFVVTGNDSGWVVEAGVWLPDRLPGVDPEELR